MNLIDHSKRPLIHLIAIVIVPVALFLFDIIPFAFRFHAFGAMTIVSIMIVMLDHISAEHLGLNNVQWNKSAVAYSFATIPLIVVLFLAPRFGVSDRISAPDSWSFYSFYILILCPSQEFLFRSALYAAVKRHNGSFLEYVLVSSTLFAIVHVVYRDLITIIVSLGIGLIWSSIFWHSPNLYLVSLSHAILGFLTIRLGLI